MVTKKRETRQSLFWKGMARMAQGKSVKRIDRKLGKLQAKAKKRKMKR
jgi:hypothetical protein